jgi:hypothetical protein
MSPAFSEGINMKIKVVKKATKTAKPSGYCPILVDDVDAGTQK